MTQEERYAEYQQFVQRAAREAVALRESRYDAAREANSESGYQMLRKLLPLMLVCAVLLVLENWRMGGESSRLHTALITILLLGGLVTGINFLLWIKIEF